MEKVYPRVARTDISCLYLRQPAGRVAYFPFDIDRTFWEVLSPDHLKVLRNAILWANNEAPVVEVDGRGRSTSPPGRNLRHNDPPRQPDQPHGDEGTVPRLLSRRSAYRQSSSTRRRPRQPGTSARVQQESRHPALRRHAHRHHTFHPRSRGPRNRRPAAHATLPPASLRGGNCGTSPLFLDSTS